MNDPDEFLGRPRQTVQECAAETPVDARSLDLFTNPGLASLFWTPTRAGAMSAWWGHVPFAHWLVAAIKPGLVVELGTHNGVSFSAFCEAVDRLSIPAQCHAVDTWQGDEHAGFYSEEVFRDLSGFVRDRYGAFAELIRLTFDEALDYFADGSIDLLHIDGLHTYEAVRYDFENWLPKLSNRAVVLFHDTNVRERDFGVWRLWGELRKQYPCFEFFHCHGLGVAAVGGDIPDAVAALCALETEEATSLRARLAQLGERWLAGSVLEQVQRHAHNLEADRERLAASLSEHVQHVSNLEADRVRVAAQVEALQHGHEGELRAGEAEKAARAELEAAHARLNEQATHINAQLVRCLAELADTAAREATQNTTLSNLRREVETIRQEAENARRESHEREDQIIALQKALYQSQAGERERTERFHRTIHNRIESARRTTEDNERALAERLEAANAEFAAIYGSTSWRLTTPLRAARSLGRGDRKPGLTLAMPPTLSEVPWPALFELPQATPEPEPALAQPDPPAPLHPDAVLLHESGLFDAAFYPGRDEAETMGIDSALHYLRHGEAIGLPPGPDFDPVFYRERHLDLRDSPLKGMLHYLHHGRSEGRSIRAAADLIDYPVERIVPGLGTIVVAVHEATRTGAAILAWNIVGELRRRYNVVVLLKQGGAIEAALDKAANAVVRLPADFVIQDAETDALARRLTQHYTPAYVIANSAETRYYVPSLERAGIPVVALLHEFSSNVRPLGTLHHLFRSASEIVFSAQIVADSAAADYFTLAARQYKVLPQGACLIPPGAPDASMTIARSADALPAADGSLLVIGLGTVNIRKGVEFFIAAAAACVRREPDRRVVFAWVGKCYWFDESYLDYCNEQIRRSGLEKHVVFLGEFEDLEPVYARADLCLLSSRLDPLPNVAIDCLVRGVPVVCFDKASGIADILKESPTTRDLVVPYLDAETAGALVATLAGDSQRLSTLSEAAHEVGRERFDMVRYVDEIDQLGRAAAADVAQGRRDHATIAGPAAPSEDASRTFNPLLYRGPVALTTAEEAVRHYLHASHLVVPRGRPRTGVLVRRPLEGFHPLIYAAEAPDYDEAGGEDPLAHFLRQGRPAGRWSHTVLRPQETAGTPVPQPTHSLRVALHGHFHYVDLLEDFLTKLERNATPVDLLLTTTSEERAARIARTLSERGVRDATVEVVPNLGRDIGAMLTGLASKLQSYDVIGHFHGKRSPHADAGVGDTWREFLWQHLLGGDYAMLDLIVRAFTTDSTLGLVFAEDPHLNDWDENRALADALAVRMGLPPLPNHIEFPLGTMFWSRPAALRPLLDLGLQWEDYPPEPLPIDGTMMHAIERLVTFSATKLGYSYATTHLCEWMR